MRRVVGRARHLCRDALGIAADTTTHGEKLVSGLGAVLGILAVFYGTQWYLGEEALAWVLASMGATAVLLFAVPHGALSQPWAVLPGHVLSGSIGVGCATWLPEGWLAAALAVGLSVSAMHYARCMHPPGGATALAAVIGGPEIQALGFGFLLAPVLLNVLTILSVAVVFNGLFPWRRYPAVLARRHQPVPVSEHTELPVLEESDLQAALEGINSLIDVTPEDLAELLELAIENALARQESLERSVTSRVRLGRASIALEEPADRAA